MFGIYERLKLKSRRPFLGAVVCLLGGTMLLGACRLPREDAVPMPTVWKAKDPGVAARTLVVFLPGRHDRPVDFIEYGFVDALWDAGVEADVVLPDAHLGYYYKRTFSERFKQDVIIPAQEKGYEQIWAVGVSLGGFGALMFERADPGTWDGVVLIAPFLGDDKEVLDRVFRSPRLSAVEFRSDTSEDDYTENFWAWMQSYEESPSFPIFLGYGDQDRMHREHAVIAKTLPEKAVFESRGKHEWPVWQDLWSNMVGALPIGSNKSL